MLQLRVFGGLTLSRGEENLTGAVSQRRRLALLALLAVEQDVGLSRDKLLLLLAGYAARLDSTTNRSVKLPDLST